jgi:hypothetical protein
MNATDKRYAAIKMVSDLALTTTPDGNTFNQSREQIAKDIRAIARFGRTDRWQAAIEGWAVAVETEDSLEWAFLQYSIWASHAAD